MKVVGSHGMYFSIRRAKWAQYFWTWKGNVKGERSCSLHFPPGRNRTEMQQMMVWKMYLLSSVAISLVSSIQVKFLRVTVDGSEIRPTTWHVWNPKNEWDKLPYQLVNAGFLNHQQYGSFWIGTNGWKWGFSNLFFQLKFWNHHPIDRQSSKNGSFGY